MMAEAAPLLYLLAPVVSVEGIFSVAATHVLEGRGHRTFHLLAAVIDIEGIAGIATAQFLERAGHGTQFAVTVVDIHVRLEIAFVSDDFLLLSALSAPAALHLQAKP